MKLLKSLLALALVLTMGVTLAACGTDTPNPSTEPSDDATTAPVTESTEAPTTEPASDKIVYTVTVVDENGDPVANAMVQLCLESCIPGQTDANGVATFQMEEEGEYKVGFIVVPDGFAAEEAYYFADGAHEMTITLKAA